MSSVLLDPIVQVERDLESNEPPQLESYDPGEECSFAHLVRVRELVEFYDSVPDRPLINQ